MRTHWESVPDNSLVVQEIVDEYDVFECSKGHKWESSLNNRLNFPLPLDFPTPAGYHICPVCLDSLLETCGRIRSYSFPARFGVKEEKPDG